VSDQDVVVIGAGAAGIGAGLALTRLEIPFVILEAKDRIGGRAYSESHSIGHLWDHGCHWFHSSEDNPLRKIALKIGHTFHDAPQPYSTALHRGGRWHGTEDMESAISEMYGAAISAGKAGRDTAASDFANRGNPLYPLARQTFNLSYSEEPENVSTLDAANFRDTYSNIPIEGGYGALVARLGNGLPIRLRTPVTRIEVLPDSVAVSTDSGVIRAKAVVLAVPTSVIGRGGIVVAPALPAEIVEAYEKTPMGWFEKIAFAFDADVFGVRADTVVDIFDDAMPMAFSLNPFGQPTAIGLVAGHTARDLALAGDAALTEFALTSLQRAFGPEIRKRVIKTAVTRWASDPHIGGAYSCARPGFGHVRQRFSQSVHDRIFIAGEHASTQSMATAHGAYLTGLSAAYRAAGAPETGIDPLWLSKRPLE
jgi:monoamine oxidase